MSPGQTARIRHFRNSRGCVRVALVSDGDWTAVEASAVRAAIDARLSELGWSRDRLAKEAGVATTTASQFLRGDRSNPRPRVKLAFEMALGWEPGALDRIASTRPNEVDTLRAVDKASTDGDGARMVLDFDVDITAGMTREELAEIRKQAEAQVLRLRRQILAERPPAP